MNQPILTNKEIKFYKNNGYLIPEFRLTYDRLTQLQNLANQLIDNNPQFLDTPMVCPHVPDSGIQGLRGDKAWFEFSADPNLLDMAEQLIGPDIILWGTNLFHKPPENSHHNGGRRIPFHRDGRYWPIEPLKTMTVWIAIESTNRANGCLQVIPNSHLTKQVGNHYTSSNPTDAIPETLDSREFDPNKSVYLELEAGQMVLFDVFTIHGSDANVSINRRIGYAMRYMPSTSWFNHDGAERREFSSNGHNTRPLFLMRGTDRCGKNDFLRGHPEA